jgi:cytochrome c oxidase assembly protein subunit 15
VRISPRRYRTITAVALGLLTTIVITGGAVRLTGSGLGCDDWPRCSQQKLVDVSSTHAAIEQVNRMFTGLVAVAVILAVLGSLWRRPRRRDLTWLSVGLVAGVIGQIVLGGVTVLVDLNPFAVASHMLLSQAIVACAVVLVRRAGEPDGPRRPIVSATARRLCWALTVVTGAAIVAGTVVTGAGPHAGSEDVQRFDVEITDAARTHGTLVLLAVALAIVLAVSLQRRPADRRALQGALSSWIFVAVLQATVGYVQYFNEVPAMLVGLHIAGATALWSMTVWLLLSTGAPAPAAVPAAAPAPEQGAVRPAGTFTP